MLDRRARQARRAVRLLVAGAAGLVPWTALLAVSLPAEREVHQWRLAWAGFDVLLIGSLVASAVLARRRHRAAVVALLVTGVLLVCDAWFDVSLDVGTKDIWLSLAMAVFVELPAAGWMIRKAYRLIA